MDKYVYSHSEDGQIVYIGKGVNDRAWCNSRSRKKVHADWMKSKHPFLEVEILGHGLSEEDARSLESELILKHKPKFNVKIPGVQLGGSKGHKKYTSVLTEEQIEWIQEKYEEVKELPRNHPDKLTMKQLGDMFGLGRHSIALIIQKEQ